jgi:multicomponent K+:H+ antiporter subunit A
MAVPALLMTMLFPVVCALAVFLLLRGHDMPGGGFVAGVTMAVAFILQYMAHGTAWVEARLRVLPIRWMGTGLLLAAGVGAGAWLFGRPFLTSSFSYAEIPLLGSIPMASAFLFDIGVFALVVGATVLMLIAIAHQSMRSQRSPAVRESVTPAVSPSPEAR